MDEMVERVAALHAAIRARDEQNRAIALQRITAAAVSAASRVVIDVSGAHTGAMIDAALKEGT
jgi:hypothetical protein